MGLYMCTHNPCASLTAQGENPDVAHPEDTHTHPRPFRALPLSPSPCRTP